MPPDSAPRPTLAGRLAAAARGVLRPAPQVVHVQVPVPQPRPPFVLSAMSVRPDEIGLVEALVERANGFDGPVVEVGCLFGMTTTRMALKKAPGKVIHVVDNFYCNPFGLTPAEHRELTEAILGYLIGRGEVVMHVQDKGAFYDGYAGPPPALAFLDAVHTYEETAKDIAWAKRAGTRIVAGHDYSPDFPGVMQAVDEAGGPADLAGSVWALPVGRG